MKGFLFFGLNLQDVRTENHARFACFASQMTFVSNFNSVEIFFYLRELSFTTLITEGYKYNADDVRIR